MLTLYIGNKNYSSWSMRPWVLMKARGIAFTEVKVRFDSFDAGSAFRRTMDELTPVGKVPLLMRGGGAAGDAPGKAQRGAKPAGSVPGHEAPTSEVIWDSLAITEALAEWFPEAGVWPTDARARARARSLCATMHSGFSRLRSLCPMNIEADLPEVGAHLWAEHADLRAEVALLERLWQDSLQRTEAGGFLMGEFSAADAFYAPVVTRLKTYRLPVSAASEAYMARVLAHPAVAAWVTDALAEQDFLDFEEPYRKKR
jgi:glutathione S-transferase